MNEALNWLFFGAFPLSPVATVLLVVAVYFQGETNGMRRSSKNFNTMTRLFDDMTEVARELSLHNIKLSKSHRDLRMELDELKRHGK